jgi:hypothetical protein
MGCLGRHLALTQEEADHLQRIAEEGDEDELWEAIQEIEERLPEHRYQDTDKSWDNIHRALTLDNTPGGCLDPDEGDYPLALCIMGGVPLCYTDNYHAYLAGPASVAALAAALADVEETWVRKRFFTLDPEHTEYPVDEDQFAYLWSWLRQLPAFYARAAGARMYVLFTATL